MAPSFCGQIQRVGRDLWLLPHDTPTAEQMASADLDAVYCDTPHEAFILFEELMDQEMKRASVIIGMAETPITGRRVYEGLHLLTQTACELPVEKEAREAA